MDRRTYRDIARRVKKLMKSEHGKSYADAILNEFRTMYKRRPAMIDELNKNCPLNELTDYVK